MKAIKVSKEIGVGFNTVVEYLKSNGFKIEAKPTAKVSEEMYQALLKEFKSSYAIRGKADKIVLGHYNVPVNEPLTV